MFPVTWNAHTVPVLSFNIYSYAFLLFRKLLCPHDIRLVISTFLYMSVCSNVFSRLLGVFHTSVRYYCVIIYVSTTSYFLRTDLAITYARSKSYIVARGIYVMQSSILSFLINVSKCDRCSFQNCQG